MKKYYTNPILNYALTHGLLRPRCYKFLLFACLALGSFFSYSQNPGGVTPVAWYRADAPATVFSDAGITQAANNAMLQQWNEFKTGNFNLIQATAASKPVFSNATTLANFNPTVTFDGSNDWMQFTAGTGVNVIDRATGTLFAAGYMNTQKRSGFLGFNATMDYPGLHVYATNFPLLFYTGGPGYNGVSTNPITAQTFFSAGAGWQNGGGSSASYAGATVSLNGTRTDYSATQLYNANLSTAARDLRIGGDNNYGSFSGQLNEVLVFEDRLSIAQFEQVETYLAIKYGTTYAAGLNDYKNATGATVWTATANSSYKANIAGIARDDNGALHQKQSRSTNTGTQVIISTTGLANTNAANATGLADGQYLIWGDNGLAKTPTMAFSAIAGLSHRFASVWKVQNTGSVGTVRVAWPQGLSNLTLLQNTDPTFAAGNTATSMIANTTTINGILYNYADVTLANGQYFTFAVKLAAPGGVTTGLLMWHKANDGTTGAGGKSVWKDISGNGRDVIQNNNATYQPALVTNASYTANSKEYSFNFNPFYYLDGTNDFFYRTGDNYFPSANSPGSAYGVMYNSAVGGWRTPYGWGDDDPNLNRADNGYYFIRDNGSVLSANVNLTTTPVHIGSMLWRGSTNGVYLNVNGQIFSTTGYNIGGINTASNFAIGSEGYNLTGTGNELFQGSISEVFSYSVDHQNSGGDEKQRINSYLAIKYGITLKNDAGTGVPNYLSSASAVVWDATTNTGYNNSIAGLANDENSALSQKQSRSNVTGQQVLIGTTGLANTNVLNGTALTIGQYLVWGDNGLARVPAVSISGVAAVNYRFAAVWKVQNTGSVGTVRVAWPTGLVNLTLVQSTDPTFATVSSSTNMTGNTTSINGVGYNYADVTLANGEYFTFATQLNGPGGVGLNLRVWLKSDAGFTPADWTDFSGNSNNYTQTNSSRQPFTAAKQYNFNPVIDFGTTGADARFMAVPSGKPYSANGTSSTLFTATLSKSASGYTDIIGFGGTTTGSGVVNANLPTFTKQDGSLVLYPYTTAPSLPSVVLNRLYLDDVSYTVGVAGIKYGQNGQTATTAQTFVAGNALHANGSILGSQPEVRNGLIGEVIAYERDLTEPEKQRVRSYVAIKYGITLPHNYIASNATTNFWNISTNTGYNNNIAGIARDDYGSLNQRQSQSINPGNQVLISTTGLTTSNAINTTMLNDQQFLVWGDNGLAKSLSVTVTGIPGVNARFAAIWKVQNTNAVGTVRVAWPKGYANLKLIQSADVTFDAGDVIADMSGTQVVNELEYAYTDVSFTDGQYFTFMAQVQAPAAVLMPNVWLRANEGTNTTTDGSSLSEWINYGSSAGITEPLLPDNGTPKYQQNAHNFNPAALDNTTGIHDGLLLRDVFPSYAQRALSTFVLQSQPTVSQTRTMISFGNNASSASSLDEPWFASNTANSFRFFWQSSYQPTLTFPNSLVRYNDVPTINSFYAPMWTANPHTVTTSMNGALTTASGNSSVSNGLGQYLFIHGDGGNNNTSEGSISEIISYDRDLTAVEKQRINSYLAIKYGITLRTDNGAAVPNYVNSSGSTVWDASVSTYNNHIAGVGRDLVLHQKQSKSVNVNTNNQVIMGVGEIAETNATNANSLSDGQFLLWGDNGNTQAMTNTVGTFTTFSYSGGTDNGRRMNRIWKVQNTNVTNQVLIRFPVASVGTTTLPAGEACASYAIIFADDAGFTTNLTALPLVVNGTDYEITHSFPNGASFFSFARLTPLNSGTIYLPGIVENTTSYTDNCGVGEWKHFHKTGDIAEKMLGFSQFTNPELNNFVVTITPEGAYYDDGAMLTSLMPRIATVVNNNIAPLSTGKVRVYYSTDELAASIVAGAQTNSWVKYEGSADELIEDIYSDGRLDAGKTTILTPAASGIEDGVNYVEFHNISSFSGFAHISSTLLVTEVLPVKLSYFKAAKQNEVVSVSWGTTTEHNNKGFHIERSTDAGRWTDIGFVSSKAQNGNSNALLQYDFVDQSPLPGVSYYRLKQIDFDGKYEYSTVRSVNATTTTVVAYRVYPNPVSSSLTIDGLNGVSRIKIVDKLGKVLTNTVTTASEKVKQLDLSSLPHGVYFIIVTDDKGKTTTRKIVRN